jgi:hypothetical protein
MSNGRPYTTTPDTAPVTPGDGSGGRGSWNICTCKKCVIGWGLD